MAEVGCVVEGAGAVGVDVVHVGEVQPALSRRAACSGRTATVGCRSGHVMGVGVCAVALHLAVNARPARLCMLQILKNDNARTLANDEAVALRVKGSTGFLRGMAPLGKRPHSANARDR